MIINYTPHTVTVRTHGGKEYIYPATGKVARVEMLLCDQPLLDDGCPTCTVVYGEAQLPQGEEGRYIVSTMFADAYRRQHGRNGIQLFVPDSGPDAIREGGQIVAVRRLIRR